jgi:two-component system, chemotaxis family, response regulator Rcp1
MNNNRPTGVLLVQDNPGDVMLITEAMAETATNPEITSVRDGIEALKFLRREAPFQDAPRPAIIILDLNLPRKDGKAVLAEIKSDPGMADTPVIIFSGSDAPKDISTCYALHANCYIVKPRDLFGMKETIRSLVDFWLTKVRLPAEQPPDAGGELENAN